MSTELAENLNPIETHAASSGNPVRGKSRGMLIYDLYPLSIADKLTTITISVSITGMIYNDGARPITAKIRPMEGDSTNYSQIFHSVA